MAEQALVRRTETTELAAPLSAHQIRDQVNLIQEVMRGVMQEGQHFGVIPGCGNKPTLLKPGAEKLALTFRLAPTFDIVTTELPGGHREYRVTCTLRHITSGDVVGQGVGSCSTMESKYRYRDGGRTCPKCGKAAIIKGKAEYGGGYICFAKKDGCGAKFADNDPSIAGQGSGKTENPDIADTYNTVLKMAKKRAQVDATLTATAASDIFTQDIEDFAPPIEDAPPPARPQPTRAAQSDPADPASAEFASNLAHAFIGRGFDPDQMDAAVSATLKAKGWRSIGSVPAGDRQAFMDAVNAGKFDKYRTNGKAVPTNG